MFGIRALPLFILCLFAKISADPCTDCNENQLTPSAPTTTPAPPNKPSTLITIYLYNTSRCEKNPAAHTFDSDATKCQLFPGLGVYFKGSCANKKLEGLFCPNSKCSGCQQVSQVLYGRCTTNKTILGYPSSEYFCTESIPSSDNGWVAVAIGIPATLVLIALGAGIAWYIYRKRQQQTEYNIINELQQETYQGSKFW